MTPLPPGRHDPTLSEVAAHVGLRADRVLRAARASSLPVRDGRLRRRHAERLVLEIERRGLSGPGQACSGDCEPCPHCGGCCRRGSAGRASGPIRAYDSPGLG